MHMSPSFDLSLLVHVEVWTALTRWFSEYLAVIEAVAKLASYLPSIDLSKTWLAFPLAMFFALAPSCDGAIASSFMVC